MGDRPAAQPGDPPRLDSISTQWAALLDPVRFVDRYASAVRAYLQAILRDPDAAEEVAQEFFARLLARGIARTGPDRGRFRDYLKAAVRNAAISHLRARKPTLAPDALDRLAAPAAEGEGDDPWATEWRRCLLDRAWMALDRREREAPEGRAYTVLRLATEHPDLDSAALAARVPSGAGPPMRADAFRKQLSRARRWFAEAVLREVIESLEQASPERVQEELIDLGLLEYVRDFLPPEWREGGRQQP